MCHSSLPRHWRAAQRALVSVAFKEDNGSRNNESCLWERLLCTPRQVQVVQAVGMSLLRWVDHYHYLIISKGEGGVQEDKNECWVNNTNKGKYIMKIMKLITNRWWWLTNTRLGSLVGVNVYFCLSNIRVSGKVKTLFISKALHF